MRRWIMWKRGWVLVLVVLLGCSSMRVYTDFDPSTDFSAYSTYAWFPEPKEATGNFRLDNPILHRRVRDAIDQQLRMAGHEEVATEAASFLITYHVTIERRQSVTSTGGYVGGGYCPGGYCGGAVVGSDVHVTDYDQGTLVLDILDAESRELVWRGAAEDWLDPEISPAKREKRINKAYQLILQRFPPK